MYISHCTAGYAGNTGAGYGNTALTRKRLTPGTFVLFNFAAQLDFIYYWFVLLLGLGTGAANTELFVCIMYRQGKVRWLSITRSELPQPV